MYKKILLLIFIFSFLNLNFAQSISSTAHNLSVSGTGTIKASTESEICVFCHTPHKSTPRKPLWNKYDTGFNYTLYNSSTIHASPGQPDGSSILCLSCHDGTIALGLLWSRQSVINFTGNVITLTNESTNLETDLSDDHIISLIYSSHLSDLNDELKNPNSLVNNVRLENSKLQCTSCHDPHLNLTEKFLVETREYSQLCINCHDKNGWNSSTHSSAIKSWNGIGTDPWPNSALNTVAQNGCENCHTPHNAEGKERLMKFQNEEINCLSCHNGNVADSDILSQMNKPYKHDVFNYTQIHDPIEPSEIIQAHVECADCHNPHKLNSSTANAPFANGFISGVKGIDTEGISKLQIDYEYELCYRCHADSPNKPGSITIRQIEQNNTRLEFDINNPSFHPIEGTGKNSSVPSLVSPLTETSLIYCTNCHSSDDSNSPKGPHGSSNPQILKYNYSKIYGTAESYLSYELCYQCHNRDEIINGVGRFQNRVHRRHIVIANIPCNFCHDPHGIDASQGNLVNNSNLINFDLSEAEPHNGILEFVDNGNFTGSCYLTCHGRVHAPKTY
ncbi:MAG: hypothetical protein IPH62_06460 [Ignavibacteriae bacterium]|nr:hypothetical protein [Ignavibacteriota bacterium]